MIYTPTLPLLKKIKLLAANKGNTHILLTSLELHESLFIASPEEKISENCTSGTLESSYLRIIPAQFADKIDECADTIGLSHLGLNYSFDLIVTRVFIKISKIS